MKIKIRKSQLKIAILLMPFFTFALGYKWPFLGEVISTERYLFLAFLIIFTLSSKRIVSLIKEKTFIFLVLFYAVVNISTSINGEQIENSLQLMGYGVVPFLVFCKYWDKKNCMASILSGIDLSFSILIIINMFIMIIYPEGIYSTNSTGIPTPYYLFGGKNQMVAPLITGICFFIESSYNKYNKLTNRALIKIIICIGEIIFGGSTTGLVITTMIMILLFIGEKRNKIIRTNISLISIVVLFVSIVILRMQNIFAFFIEKVLHKSLDLTNRTDIWDSALFSIDNNPILGTGVSSSLAGNVHLVLSYVEKDIFAHDMYLDILVMGGICALSLFIIMIIIVKIEFDRGFTKYNELSFIWIGFWLYLLASLFDIYTGNYCMYIMIAYIVSQYNNKRMEDNNIYV
ncbi:MAG: O-antigen ligase family protein [Clostridium sp.]|nr:O-antigen ligase family protein [Clostridium sp.]